MSFFGTGLYGLGLYGGSSLTMSIDGAVWDISYTTDDASDPSPVWQPLNNADLRSVYVARGREDELGRVEAGTAQLTLNNRERAFDPTVVPGLRPMNRWRLRAYHTNLVTNGSFETDTTGWATGGGGDVLTSSSDRSVYGSKSAKLVTDTGAFSYIQSGVFELTGGTTYTASAYVYGVSGKAMTFFIQNEAFATVAQTAFTGSASWQRVSVTFTAATTEDHHIAIWRDPGGAIDTYYMDGVQLEEDWPLLHTGIMPWDMFLGYAESYEQSWPATGKDSICVVRLVDEFKVLALDKLPVTDPPRDTYQDLVMSDVPVGYWPMDSTPEQFQQAAVVGPPLTAVGGGAGTVSGAGAIVGQEPAGYMLLQTGNNYQTVLQVGEPGDMGGLQDFAWEGHISLNVAAPTTDWSIARGPLSGGNDTWRVSMNTARKIVATFRNSGGTTYTTTSTTVWATTGAFHHVVCIVFGGSLRVYVDGVQEALSGVTGVMGAMDAGSYLGIGTGAATGTGQIGLDEMALYRHSLDGASGIRIPAHYTAATARGFARNQLPGARITSVLAASTSIAASSVRTGNNGMTGSYMRGQPPLDELRRAEEADNVDAMLFVAKDGTVTFLDDGHRSVAPWNTVQATFDDDGTDLPYREMTVDYSETHLFNTVNVTRTSGTATSTSTDSTSVSRYMTRTLSLTDLAIWDDADQATIAAALLAKYKDPMTRITSVGLTLTTSAMIAAVLDLELADRVRILRTPVGGGARIDQTAFVQSINLSAVPGQPWQLRLGVSPL